MKRQQQEQFEELEIKRLKALQTSKWFCALWMSKEGLSWSISKGIFWIFDLFHWTRTISLQGIHGLGAGGKKRRRSLICRKVSFWQDLCAGQFEAEPQYQVQRKPIFTNLKKRFEHIKLPAKLRDYFLRSNKSNINQTDAWGISSFLPSSAKSMDPLQ